MPTLETDYLIVGAGAAGLSFADTLLTETDARIAIVDRHGKPGGHWNDAYSFVALHQPSAFYGVSSLPLGTNRKDTAGINAGLFELATGPEVSGYFDAVMHRQLLPSGRVSYHPMADYQGDGRFVSLLSGKETRVHARRKIVDATYYGTSVPATHKVKFPVKDGVRLVPPNILPNLWLSSGPRPSAFVVVGAGKTAMDVVTWLLGSGADEQSIHWIVPRDSWLLNRRTTQPGAEYFDDVFGAQAAQMQAFAESETVDEIFDRLEAAKVVLRIDRNVRPTMFHYATISEGEVEQLRRVRNVVRLGRVTALDRTKITLVHGDYSVPEGALFIDCTASAVEDRPVKPIFDGALITLQMVRIPQPTFSAALLAYVEAHYGSDDEKNTLCRPVPFPQELRSYPQTNVVNMMNQGAWMQDKQLTRWLRANRLDGFGKMLAAIDPNDTAKIDLLTRLRGYSLPAIENLMRLAKFAESS